MHPVGRDVYYKGEPLADLLRHHLSARLVMASSDGDYLGHKLLSVTVGWDGADAEQHVVHETFFVDERSTWTLEKMTGSLRRKMAETENAMKEGLELSVSRIAAEKRRLTDNLRVIEELKAEAHADYRAEWLRLDAQRKQMQAELDSLQQEAS